MSSNPRDEQYNKVLVHLQSPNSDTRKRAIRWLVKAGRSDAMRPLKWTAESDPDPQVRTYAQKAIRFLSKQTQTIPAIHVPPDPNPNSTLETPAIRISDDPPEQSNDTGSLTDLRRTASMPVIRPSGKTGTGKRPERGDTGKLNERRGNGQRPSTENPSKRKTLLQRAIEVDAEPEAAPKSQPVRNPDDLYLASHEEQMAAIIEGYEVYAYQDPNSPDYVSRDHWEQARTLIGEAYSQFIHDDPVSKVVTTIGRAVELDKNVVEEEPAKKAIRAAIDGMSLKKATSLILDPDRRAFFVSQLRKKERYGLAVYSTWVDVFVDLLGYFVTHVIGIAVVLYLTAQEVAVLINRAAADPELAAQIRLSGNDPIAPFRPLASLLSGYTPETMIMYALRAGALLTLLLLIGHLVTHLVIKVAGGTASLTETLVNLSRPALWMSLATYVVSIAVVVALFPQTVGQVDNIQTLILNLSRYLLLLPLLILIGQQVWHLRHLHEVSVVAASVAYLLTALVMVGIGYGAYVTLPVLTL